MMNARELSYGEPTMTSLGGIDICFQAHPSSHRWYNVRANRLKVRTYCALCNKPLTSKPDEDVISVIGKGGKPFPNCVIHGSCQTPDDPHLTAKRIYDSYREAIKHVGWFAHLYCSIYTKE